MKVDFLGAESKDRARLWERFVVTEKPSDVVGSLDSEIS